MTDAIAEAQAEALRQLKTAKRTALEDRLARDMDALGIRYQRQFQFDPNRRWRSDFSLTGTMLLIECHGGTFTNGRHVRGKGFQKDCEKQNAAVILGFRPLVFSSGMITRGVAIRVIQEALNTEQYYA